DYATKQTAEAIELVGILEKPSIEAKCWFWHGQSLYYNGEITEAVESFMQSKEFLYISVAAGENFSGQEGYDEIDLDKWLKHCQKLLEWGDTENSDAPDGRRGFDGSATVIPWEEPATDTHPDIPWNLLPRSRVGIANWA